MANGYLNLNFKSEKKCRTKMSVFKLQSQMISTSTTVLAICVL